MTLAGVTSPTYDYKVAIIDGIAAQLSTDLGYTVEPSRVNVTWLFNNLPSGPSGRHLLGGSTAATGLVDISGFGTDVPSVKGALKSLATATAPTSPAVTQLNTLRSNLGLAPVSVTQSAPSAAVVVSVTAEVTGNASQTAAIKSQMNALIASGNISVAMAAVGLPNTDIGAFEPVVLPAPPRPPPPRKRSPSPPHPPPPRTEPPSPPLPPFPPAPTTGCLMRKCYPGVPCSNADPLQVAVFDSSYVCGACPAGTRGDGVECTEYDMCAADDPTHPNGGCDPRTTCTQTAPGVVQCGPCPEGYLGTGKDGCRPRVGDCSANNGGCAAGTACIPDGQPGAPCGPCPAGLGGSGATACEDVDACLPRPCFDNGASAAKCYDVPAAQDPVR